MTRTVAKVASHGCWTSCKDLIFPSNIFSQIRELGGCWRRQPPCAGSGPGTLPAAVSAGQSDDGSSVKKKKKLFQVFAKHNTNRTWVYFIWKIMLLQYLNFYYIKKTATTPTSSYYLAIRNWEKTWLFLLFDTKPVRTSYVYCGTGPAPQRS